MRKLNKSKASGTWFQFKDDPTFKLNIRPISQSSINIKPNETIMNQANMLECFKYIVIDWSGYKDEKEQDIECNDEMKSLVFDFDQEVAMFSLEKAMELRDEIVIVDEADNLKKKLDGTPVNKDK